MITRSIPLWESKWPAAVLQDRRKTLGSLAFGRGYRQEPINDENLLFKSFKDCILYQKIPINNKWSCYTGVDPGGKNRPGSVIFTLAVNELKKRIPLDIRRGAWTPDKLAREIINVNGIYRPRVVLFENNALQEGYISLVKQISPDKSLPIKGFTTGKNKHDEREGLPGLEIDFENNAWEIYLGEKKHDYNCLCPWCTWQNEMTGFPGCENTDTVMACWFAWEAIRFYSGVRVRYAER